MRLVKKPTETSNQNLPQRRQSHSSELVNMVRHRHKRFRHVHLVFELVQLFCLKNIMLVLGYVLSEM